MPHQPVDLLPLGLMPISADSENLVGLLMGGLAGCGKYLLPNGCGIALVSLVSNLSHSVTPFTGNSIQSLRLTESHASRIASIKSKSSRSANPHMKITR